MEIVDRVEVVKSEHEKLEGGNRFLQSCVLPLLQPPPSAMPPLLTHTRYIGELMQTSKLTSAGAGKATKVKGKAKTIK